MNSTPQTNGSPFGLVRPAPAWRVWYWWKGWSCIGGDNNRAKAQRACRDLGGDLVLAYPAEPAADERPGDVDLGGRDDVAWIA